MEIEVFRNWQNKYGMPDRGRKFFCVFKIGSSIQLELDM